MPITRSARVVLVDASNGLRVGEEGIPPHSALLFIPRRFIAGLPECIDGLTRVAPGLPSAWRMSGVQLELESDSTELSWDPAFACLPSLTAVAGDPNPPLDIDPRVVDDGDLACVFRIGGGILFAYAGPRMTPGPRPPVIGKLTVDVTDWTKAQLKVTRIWNQRTSTIQLRPYGGEDPHIIVANVGTTTDAEGDFTLHYGVTTLTPKAPVHPEGGCSVPEASREDRKALESFAVVADATGLAEGCSNSTYP
jgi:hypothetical protein